MGLGLQRYNRSDFTFKYTLTFTLVGGDNLGTFYAKKLKFGMLLTSLQFCARVTPESCPEVGLEVQKAGYLCTFDTCLVFL